LLIDGNVKSPLAGGPVDQIPDALAELHPLKGAAFLYCESGILYGLVVSEIFFVVCLLKIG